MTTSNFPRAAFIGFESIFNEIEKCAQTYPPHNIVRHSENEYAIELAVVGFTESDITMTLQDGTLNIQGVKHEQNKPNYIHHGISGRSFRRWFRLSEHVEVKGASLKDGMLVVKLERVIPEEKRPRLIPINDKLPTTHTSEITHDESKKFLAENLA